MATGFAVAAVLTCLALGSSEEPPLVAGRDVAPPKKVKSIAAPFPDIARRAFPPIEGIVVLQVTLSEVGRPVDILVLKGIPILDLGAIAAVKQWEYEPTSVDGVARRVMLKAVLEFFLSPKSREHYLIEVVSATREDVGLRLYAIQSLVSDPLDRKAVRKALEKTVHDKNEALAGAAKTALATLGGG